jgi:acyl-CoA thioester hydrolase
MSKPFTHCVRVRYSEVDPGRIAFHSHYYSWFDAALREFGRAGDLSFSRSSGDSAGRPQAIVREFAIRFFKAAAFDDQLDIEVRLTSLGNDELNWSLTVRRGGELLADGRVAHGFASPGDGAPCPIPTRVRSELEPLLG